VIIQEESGRDWHMVNADSVEFIKSVPDNSVGLSVYSPPFSSLYTYSDSERDMGNCRNDEEFFEHYSYLAGELLRITKPGRLACVHCKDLVDYANSSETGRAGLRDFPGGLIKAHERAGWKYHSRVTIWKDPVIEMQRTKAHGLLYKQLRADGSFSRQGLAEYVLTFRKWPAEGDPIDPVTHDESTFPLNQWQEYASPVWNTVDQTNVLNVQVVRSDKDEKHLCPLQLDVVERCVVLWSNPGDVVFSPFGGIGSEGYEALRLGRKFLGCELKPEYWVQACRNLKVAESGKQLSLFGGA
jgi:DNA modification methylase